MTANTLTMPRETTMGILVSSCEACKPKRIGIKMIKKPKTILFSKAITISENFAEFNKMLAYASILIPKINLENKIPLPSNTTENKVLNKTMDITPLITLGTRR